MKKVVFIFALVLLFGVIAYTIRANASKEVTVIKIPEGTITETMTEVEEVPASNPPANPSADSVIVVETIEVPEGIITVRSEMSGSQVQSSSQTPEDSSANTFERVQEQVYRDELLRMIERRHQLEHEDSRERLQEMRDEFKRLQKLFED